MCRVIENQSIWMVFPITKRGRIKTVGVDICTLHAMQENVMSLFFCFLCYVTVGSVVLFKIFMLELSSEKIKHIERM